jgi:hemolysin D
MPRANLTRLDPSPSTGSDPARLIRAFSSDAGEIHATLHPVMPRMAVYLLATLIIGFLVIANLFDMDRVVESFEGHVVTVEPTIALQALDASIIKSLDVEEGQIVKKGQLLETLDPTFAAADVRALQIQIASLDAEIARDEAELAGRPLVYPPTEDLDAQKYQTMQTMLHLQRMQQYDQQIKAYDEQIATSRATIAKLREDEDELDRRKVIATRVEKMFTTLQAQESGSQLQFLQAQDGTVQVVKQLEFDKNSISETEHTIAAALANREAFVQQWLAQTSQDLVTSRNSRDGAVEQLAKASRHSDLVRVTAPDDCIVLEIPQVSVGSVVKQGDPIMKLALMTAPVEVEIAVLPRDIGFVRKGDEVTVKLDEYEFIEHGTATGRVRWISEGTFNQDLINENTQSMSGNGPQPYYKVRVALEHLDFFDVPKDFRLLPGMTLTSDIHVGERHLFRYLLKDLVRTGVESMREPE